MKTNDFLNKCQKLRILSASTGMKTPDGVYVEFPNYSVSTGIGHYPLGHAMVIAVDRKLEILEVLSMADMTKIIKEWLKE